MEGRLDVNFGGGQGSAGMCGRVSVVLADGMLVAV